MHGWTDIAGSKVSATSGFDPAMIVDYETHWRHLNPWSQRIVSSRAGVVLPSHDLYPEESLKKSAFYSDWVRPQEDIVAGGGVVIGRTPSGPFMFGGNVRGRDRERKHPMLMDVMRQMAPHLALAWRIGGTLLESQVRMALAVAAGPVSGAALILLRPDQTVVFADPRGEQILSAGEFCRIGRSGRFGFRDANAQDALMVALRNLGAGDLPVVLKVPAAGGAPPI